MKKGARLGCRTNGIEDSGKKEGRLKKKKLAKRAKSHEGIVSF